MKKILLVVPTLCLGGQERICVKTASLLRDKHEVKLVVFDVRDAVYKPDVEVLDINIPAGNGRIKKIIRALLRIMKLRKIRRTFKPDIVYSFGSTANITNVLSRGKGKSIIGVRAYNTIKRRTFADMYTFKKADSIVCCAQMLCEELRALQCIQEEKIKCLYNPVDIESLAEQAKEEVDDYDFSGRVIVSHGRLEKVKNWPRLIKAFYLVQKKCSDIKLLIIGEGAMRDRLSSLIQELNLEKHVKLIGYRENPFKYISRSDVYVLSSYAEGFPNSLIEGMVFLPVISVDCKSGPREILSNRNYLHACGEIEDSDYGILVKSATGEGYSKTIDNDDEMLADAIIELMQDEEKMRTYKAKSLERALMFSCDAYIESFVNLLELE